MFKKLTNSLVGFLFSQGKLCSNELIFIFKFLNPSSQSAFPLPGPSVARLQQEIAVATGVGVAQQILLLSGGVSLDPQAKLISYGAGAVSVCAPCCSQFL